MEGRISSISVGTDGQEVAVIVKLTLRASGGAATLTPQEAAVLGNQLIDSAVVALRNTKQDNAALEPHQSHEAHLYRQPSA